MAGKQASTNVLCWSVIQSPDGYFRAFRKVGGKLRCKYVGKDLSQAPEILAAANLEIENRAMEPVSRIGDDEMNQQQLQDKPAAPPIEELSLIEIAQGYARHGLPVGPIHAVREGRCTCGKKGCPGNHPAQPYSGQQTGAVQAGFYGTQCRYTCLAWFLRPPGLNIAVSLGFAVKLAALAIRGEEAESSLLELIALHGDFPDTLQFVRGDERVLLFSHRPKSNYGVPSKSGPGGLFILSDHHGKTNYMLLPPSTTPSGDRCEWVEGCGPGEVKIAEIPKWLLAIAWDRLRVGQ